MKTVAHSRLETDEEVRARGGDIHDVDDETDESVRSRLRYHSPSGKTPSNEELAATSGVKLDAMLEERRMTLRRRGSGRKLVWVYE